MNLYLHDIAGRDSPVEARNALLGVVGMMNAILFALLRVVH